MKKLPGYLLLLFVFSQSNAQFTIIPRPHTVIPKDGSFVIDTTTRILLSEQQDQVAADFFNEYLLTIYGFALKISDNPSTNYIRLCTKKNSNSTQGRYLIDILPSVVSVSGDDPQGTFYAIQTLIQLLPVDLSGQIKIKCAAIEDFPRFGYRGMHLDVARHFFPVKFIKSYIDYIALHKMNFFHWHLTDDQGWRIEIKKYPELTQTGSCRNGTIIGRYPGEGNDNKKHCGYYTQAEIMEVVEYASKRYVTVIPEIEMPGHSSAALASYPYLGCTGGPYKVQETWGIFNEVFCAGNDSVFTFLQNVLEEVVELFPSKYIHIGGDECPKTSWQKCSKCQKRIKETGIQDAVELQSYFIQRIGRYLNRKGRVLIGWDEILQGGLAPNSVVMSWQGESGGVQAAKAGHTVIMTPETHVYFDYSQTTNEDSVVFGDYTSLQKVYEYEPVPDELNFEQSTRILGAQGNLWTEYVKNPAKAEYMIFPRLSALSEVLWTSTENRNWPDFEKRLTAQYQRYKLWGVNYSMAYYNLAVTVRPLRNYEGLNVLLESVSNEYDIIVEKNGVIHTRHSNHAKNRYNDSLTIFSSATIRAWLQKGSEILGNITSSEILFNKATGKKLSTVRSPDYNYRINEGVFDLVNGIRSETGLNSHQWVGWRGKDMESIIDLGKKTKVSSVSLHLLHYPTSRIHKPLYVEVFASDNGIDFIPGGKTSQFRKEKLSMGYMSVSVKKRRCRYLKIVAKNLGLIPQGLPGAGNKAWLFIDEFIVK